MPDRPQVPSAERLLELVERMAGQPVLMAVDLVADRFVTGSPKRISREAPVLILRYQGETLAPGGGANAVANVAALGGKPLPLGVVGEDASGEQLLAALAAMAVDIRGIVRLAGYRTPTKVRILGGGRHSIKQQIVRYDIEDEVRLGSGERSRFDRALAGWGGRARVAVISDYGYGAAVPELIDPLRRAVGRDGILLCDSRFRLSEYAGLDGATPNQEEAEGLLGEGFGDDPGRLRAAGPALRQRLGARFLLITRGGRGMALFDDAGLAEVPVHGTDQVADVTGAGDTVLGTFALAVAAGASPLEATLLADYAGGVVVMKMGTATLTPEELKRAVLGDARPREETRWERL